MLRHRPVLEELTRFTLYANLMLMALGCHTPQVSHARSELPSAFERPSGRALLPYEAWERHTEGEVGEDLFPVPLRDQDALLFASNRHSTNFKLYLRMGRENTVRRLTHGPGDDIFPDLSPDGQQLVFASNRDGGWRLYLMENLEDHAPRRLGDVDVTAIHPSWSPDGRWIAYSRLSPVSGEWEIWFLDLESHEQTRVAAGLFPDFRPPEGQVIAFQRPRQRDHQWYSIWTVRTDGTREKEIVAGKAWGAVNPSWSPDGSRIVFNSVGRSPNARELPPNRGDDIYCVNADGTNLTRLTFLDTPEWNPFWSLGETPRIYFNALRDGETAIWSVTPPQK
ncbi:MAG: hypothetical protein V3T77_02715 [Planctomycetota bacterium]